MVGRGAADPVVERTSGLEILRRGTPVCGCYICTEKPISVRSLEVVDTISIYMGSLATKLVVILSMGDVSKEERFQVEC